MRLKVLFMNALLLLMALLVITCQTQDGPKESTLKVHAIFSSNMVIQRGKPIKVWGWAKPGDKVSVTFGDEQAKATADGDAGRWEVTFPAREASAEPVTLVASTGDEKVEMEDILIGDVWVSYGQSNMAIPLGNIEHGDLEAVQAHSSKLRLFSIKTSEQLGPQDNIEADAITTGGWVVSNPETARDFSAIGYVFGARIQRASQIPVGLIKNARGGAAMEALVPQHKFYDHPKAKRYAKHIEEKIAEFDPRAKALQKWRRQLKRAKQKDKPESEWPEKPDHAENLGSSIPGKRAKDRASVYNGMFGAFKGYNLKGVLFHHGYDNAMVKERCRPKFYRVLMKLMIDGVREDFNDPDLPFGVIGFCAAGKPQNRTNFEANAYKYTGGAGFIREAQRLALTDLDNPENTAFIPAYDAQEPAYHPHKKRVLGGRAARWALSELYDANKVVWATAELDSVERRGDEMVLTFDNKVVPDDQDPILRGFSIAGEDGQFYMAHARNKAEGGWNRLKVVHVWSPLVDKPVAVRYGWAVAPMGNLKVDGHPHLPLHSFRTDDWDYPESEDPTESAVTGSKMKEMQKDAAERLEYRRTEEIKRGLEIMERLKTLGRNP